MTDSLDLKELQAHEEMCLELNIESLRSKYNRGMPEAKARRLCSLTKENPFYSFILIDFTDKPVEGFFEARLVLDRDGSIKLMKDHYVPYAWVKREEHQQDILNASRMREDFILRLNEKFQDNIGRISRTYYVPNKQKAAVEAYLASEKVKELVDHLDTKFIPLSIYLSSMPRLDV